MSSYYVSLQQTSSSTNETMTAEEGVDNSGDDEVVRLFIGETIYCMRLC